MKQTIVKFIDYDVDGCGTEINSMITFNAELTEKQKMRLLELTNQIKDTEDWDFDTLVDDVCEAFKNETNIGYYYTNHDVEIIV